MIYRLLHLYSEQFLEQWVKRLCKWPLITKADMYMYLSALYMDCIGFEAMDTGDLHYL